MFAVCCSMRFRGHYHKRSPSFCLPTHHYISGELHTFTSPCWWHYCHKESCGLYCSISCNSLLISLSLLSDCQKFVAISSIAHKGLVFAVGVVQGTLKFCCMWWCFRHTVLVTTFWTLKPADFFTPYTFWTELYIGFICWKTRWDRLNNYCYIIVSAREL